MVFKTFKQWVTALTDSVKDVTESWFDTLQSATWSMKKSIMWPSLDLYDEVAMRWHSEEYAKRVTKASSSFKRALTKAQIALVKKNGFDAVFKAVIAESKTVEQLHKWLKSAIKRMHELVSDSTYPTGYTNWELTTAAKAKLLKRDIEPVKTALEAFEEQVMLSAHVDQIKTHLASKHAKRPQFSSDVATLHRTMDEHYKEIASSYTSLLNVTRTLRTSVRTALHNGESLTFVGWVSTTLTRGVANVGNQLTAQADLVELYVKQWATYSKSMHLARRSYAPKATNITQPRTLSALLNKDKKLLLPVSSLSGLGKQTAHSIEKLDETAISLHNSIHEWLVDTYSTYYATTASTLYWVHLLDHHRDAMNTFTVDSTTLYRINAVTAMMARRMHSRISKILKQVQKELTTHALNKWSKTALKKVIAALKSLQSLDSSVATNHAATDTAIATNKKRIWKSVTVAQWIEAKREVAVKTAKSDLYTHHIAYLSEHTEHHTKTLKKMKSAITKLEKQLVENEKEDHDLAKSLALKPSPVNQKRHTQLLNTIEHDQSIMDAMHKLVEHNEAYNEHAVEMLAWYKKALKAVKKSLDWSKDYHDAMEKKLAASPVAADCNLTPTK